jgi:microcystin-dependent protein
MENKMDELLGVIKQFAGNYAPENYMECDGRSLSISQYTALYSVIENVYGGDGQMSFKLPDLRPYASELEYRVLVPTVNVNNNVGSLVNTLVQGSRPATRRSWNNNELRYIICVNGMYPTRP